MLCQQCHANEATLHIHQNINGQKTEVHLCENCAKKNGQIFFSPVGQSVSFFNQPQGWGDMSSLFQDLFAAPIGNSVYKEKSEISPCPTCGTTWEAFQSNGLLGCADCYTHFAERMPALLRRLHGHTEHVGKVPSNGDAHLLEEKKMERLRHELNEAIAAEDFERACTLRDEIRRQSEDSEEASGNE